MQTIHVLARLGGKVQLVDETGEIMKWRQIVDSGLLDERSGKVKEGPVAVPATIHFLACVAQGDLVLCDSGATRPAQEKRGKG